LLFSSITSPADAATPSRAADTLRAPAWLFRLEGVLRLPETRFGFFFIDFEMDVFCRRGLTLRFGTALDLAPDLPTFDLTRDLDLDAVILPVRLDE